LAETLAPLLLGIDSGLPRRGREMEPSTRHDTAGLVVVPAVLVAVGAAAAHPKCPKQPSKIQS
jgi:hypothetical protein